MQTAALGHRTNGIIAPSRIKHNTSTCNARDILGSASVHKKKKNQVTHVPRRMASWSLLSHTVDFDYSSWILGRPRTFHTQDNQLKPAVLVPGTLRCRLCVPISTILRKA